MRESNRRLSGIIVSGRQLLPEARPYEVIPGSDLTTIVGFQALRRGWDRVSEAAALKRAANKRGIEFTEITKEGHVIAVKAKVPQEQLQNILDSMNQQGFTRGKTPAKKK